MVGRRRDEEDDRDRNQVNFDRRSAGEAADRIALLRSELDLIVRIDERTQLIANEIKDIKIEMVTKAEFSPVKILVYGMVGLILSSVMAALIAQVVIK